MSELPSGWSTSAISDLVDKAGLFIDGDWVESKDQDPNGDVRLVQLADIGDGYYRDRSNRFMTSSKVAKLNGTYLKVGDTLIARMPDPLGRACIFPGDDKPCVTVVDVCILRFGDKGLYSRWLPAFINAPITRSKISALQSGSTRKRISRGNLSTIEIPVPPLNEQKRIVAKLEELFADLDAATAALERVRTNLKRYRASVLKSAVEGKLTAEWRAKNPPKETGAELLERILVERRAKWEENQLAKFKAQGKEPPKGWREKYPEPAKPDTSDLPELPEGWVWASAEQVCNFITKGTTPPTDIEESEAQIIPFIRVTNLTSTGELDFSDQVFISEKMHRGFLARSIVYPNDVLMNIVGPPLGQVSIVPDTYAQWNINQAVAIFRPLNGLRFDFLAIALLSFTSQNWLKQRAKTTAGQTNLTLELCRALPIPIPPQPEQAAITSNTNELLTILHSLTAANTHRKIKATNLRQAILKQAFEGKLVLQDPSDEPASELLKRIREEREKAEGEAKAAKVVKEPRKKVGSGKLKKSTSRPKGAKVAR